MSFLLIVVIPLWTAIPNYRSEESHRVRIEPITACACISHVGVSINARNGINSTPEMAEGALHERARTRLRSQRVWNSMGTCRRGPLMRAACLGSRRVSAPGRIQTCTKHFRMLSSPTLAPETADDTYHAGQVETDMSRWRHAILRFLLHDRPRSSPQSTVMLMVKSPRQAMFTV